MRRFLVSLLFLAVACGVPVEPGLDELIERAGTGEATAVAALLDRLNGETPAEERSRIYRSLLEVEAVAGPEILRACGSGDPVRREHALALAANLRLPGVFEASVAALQDRGFQRRYVAAWSLGELGNPEGAPALVAVLGRESENLSRAAARALVKLGPSAVTPLLEQVSTMKPPAAAYALRVLGEIRDPRALPVLTEALESPALRAEAAWSLGKLGQPKAGNVLLGHAGDSDWRTRLEVVRALGLLELSEADPVLDRLRTEDPESPVREWAARSLALVRGTPQTFRDARGEERVPGSLYR